jgi:F-type H+-transporting ATPase subunit b
MVSRIAAGSSVLLLACGSAFASGGESDPSMLVMPQFGLIFWTVVTFLLLAFILGRFAWKPLLGAIEARERSIQESLDQARTEREDAEKLLEEHKGLVAQARRERAEAMAEGQRDAERLKAGIVEEGRKQREKLLEQAEAQIEAEMRQARTELRGIAADLSIRAAGRLLSSQLDEKAQRRLVEEYLDELEQMPDGSSPVS